MDKFNMNENLNNLKDELKHCAYKVLLDKGYTKDKAEKAIENIKNFNVYGIDTGFRVETLVDEYKIEVFYHKYKTINKSLKYATVTMYSKEPKTTTKTLTIQDKNDDLNPGGIIRPFEHQTNDRLEKLENCVSSLQSLVDTVADSLNDDVKERVQNLEKHIKCVESDVKLINGKLKFIGDNLRV